MNNVITSNARPLGGLKKLNILMDTYCATGCDYCFFAKRRKHPMSYEMEQLDGFVDRYQPSTITVFGGDTFYDINLIEKTFHYFGKKDYVKGFFAISELGKLKDDFDKIVSLIELAKSYGKTFYIRFSIDMLGVKSNVDALQYLQKLYPIMGIKEIQLNSILTADMLMSDNICNAYSDLLKIYGANDTGIKLSLFFKLNYESAIPAIPGLEEKTEVFFRHLKSTETLYPFFYYNSRIAECTSRYCQPSRLPMDADHMQNSLMVDNFGNINTCSNVDQYFDVSVSALNMKEHEYQKLLRTVNYYKTHNTDIEYCRECPAKLTCMRCIKYLKEGISNFPPDTEFVVCQFYKTIHKLSLPEVIDENKRY